MRLQSPASKKVLVSSFLVAVLVVRVRLEDFCCARQCAHNALFKTELPGCAGKYALRDLSSSGVVLNEFMKTARKGGGISGAQGCSILTWRCVRTCQGWH